MSTSTENISDDMSSNTEEKSVMSVTNVEHAENLEELEKMVNSPSYVLFDGECIRKKSNWSKSGNEYKFDTPDFDGKILLNQMKIRSPKLHELMKNIAKLDRQDQKKYGKQFKHFIFSDLKSGSHGAKLLASAFIAKGMTLGYASTLKEKAKNKEEKNESILPDIFSSKPEEKNVTQEKKTLAAKEKAEADKVAKEKAEADKVAKEKVEADKAAAQEKAVADKAASEASSESEETSESEENAESAVSSLTLPSVPYTGPTLESIRNSLPTVESIENTVNSIVNPKTEEEKEVEEEEKQLESEEENNENMVKGGAKKYEKIELLPDETLLETTGSNFYLLSSVSVYEQSLSVAMKKEMLKKFNHRPDNVHGELVRFIIMDSGFKEGIDLFDVKYIHIFEPQTTAADQKQVIGRGTRTCGQKGLVFQPNKGWPLYVFNYDISISKEHQSLFQGSTTSIELYLKAMNIDLRLMTLTSEMERMAIYGSIDYDLNKNIHNFKRATKEDDDSSVAETITGTSESVSGGAKRRIVIRDDLPPIEIGQRSEASQLLSSKVASLPENFGQPQNANIVGQGAFTPPTTNFKGDHRSPEKFEEELAIHNELHNNKNHKPVRVPDFKEIRGHIKEKYGEFAWDAVKMENLCGYAGPVKTGGDGENEEKIIGGKSTIIEYTPTQDFVRHYFTPSNPYKGMLLYHSVGTGKTATAIATASSSFEPEGYTILWVTRTTLKNDIWKNMFDQVSNERIRQIIIEGKEIPDEQAKRMRMLSPSWKIRPMSYKQFSNLVSKQNSYYKELVKINGQEDPLRKTLIIIDEAHKLYGGGDLSSLERPDMEALHKSIMNSYLVSGHESVRLLLMTATPITQDPFELVKLMNLCKLPHQQIPADFPQFSQKYLDEDGKFTGAGEDQFLNQIIGHISYLNREKDARQFSQPVIKQVLVPLVDKHTKEFIDTYDKRLTQQGMDSEIMELKKKIMDENKKLEGDLGDIDTSKFAFLKKKCDNYEEGKAKRKCNQIVRANITNIIKEVKVATKEIRDEIKSIREQIKKIQVLKGEKVSEIKRKLLENPQEFKKYENTLFYQLKYDCSKRITDTKSLTDAVHKHPAIVEIDRQMESLDNQIKELEANFKLRIVAYKNRMKNLQSLLKGDVNELEKSVIRMIIRDEQKEYRRMSRVNKKELGEQIKLTQQTKKIYQKKKHTFLRKIRRTLKSKWSDKMKAEKYKVREEKQMRKTLRKQGQIENDIKHELVKDVVDKYSVGIDKDLEDLQEQMAEFKREKEAKEAEKAVKMQQKEAEKAVKMQERAEKQQQKEAERAQKQQQKETERAEKAALRETIKNQKIEAKNLTRKNNK